MLKVNPIQTNFTGGEMSPGLIGRSDIEQYLNGAEILENFHVSAQGGIERRLGSRNIGRAASQTLADNVRLVEFIFSRNDAVCIEVSTSKFRFIALGALVGAPYTVTTIYGTATAIPYTNAQILELQFTQSADVIYITHPMHPTATLSRYGTTDWRYEIPEFYYGPYLDQEPGDQNISLSLTSVSDTVTLVSTANDFSSAVAGTTLVEYNWRGQTILGLVSLKVANNEVLVTPLEDRSLSLSSEVYSPGSYGGWDNTNSLPLYGAISTGSSVIAFSATGVITRQHIGNYLRFADTSGTYYWMLVSGTGNIEKMGAYGILGLGDVLTVVKPTGLVTRKQRTITSLMKSSYASFFDLTRDIPRSFRLVLGGQVVHARTFTNAANNGAQAMVYLNRPVPLAYEGAQVMQKGTTNDWNRGAWYYQNYPATVFFHEERLGFAGTTNDPHTVWLSRSADFYNFASTDYMLRVLDDSAIVLTIASDTVNQVLWAVSKRNLLLGTAGGEWSVQGGSNESPLTPTNAAVQGQSSYGSEFTRPILAGKSLLFLQRGARKIRKMEYDYQSDSLVSIDATVFSDHILKEHGGATRVAYQPVPDSRVYALLADGQVGVFTYEEDQKVFAWTRYVLGGTSAVVESLAVLPEGSTSRLYMVVRRTINGSTVRTLEYIIPEFRPTSLTDYTGTRFMDNCTTVTGSGSASVTGLTDFAGASVVAMVDDKIYTGLTVASGGTLTLPAAPTSYYCIGFAYTSTLRTMPLEAQAPAGTGQGKAKRINHLTLRLRNSTGFKHGLTLAALRSEDWSSGRYPVMRSEDVRVPLDNGIDVRAQYYITQSDPVPLTVLSLMPENATYQ